MLEVNDGMGSEINAMVLYSGQIVLNKEQSRFRYSGEQGLQLEFIFENDGGAPSTVPEVRGSGYRITLRNFDSTNGVAASGKITGPFAGINLKRSGTWVIRYNIAVTTIGEGESLTRLVGLTLAEARIA